MSSGDLFSEDLQHLFTEVFMVKHFDALWV